MSEIPERLVGVVGAGLVGVGWAIIFARRGHRVRVFDRRPTAVIPAIAQSLSDLVEFDLIEDPDTILSRIEIVDELGDALRGATYVQESVNERVDLKRELFRRIDGIVDPATIVGSSSSGIPASAFTEGLEHRENYLIAHPVNPPYLIPLVEIVPAPWTSPDAVVATERVMLEVGQVPIRVRKEVEGFILNRLQGALLREAWALFEQGYATISDIDKTVSYGLGYRWSFMGPFETIDLNAPGGVKDYAERLGGLYLKIAQAHVDPRPWSDSLIAAVDAERRTVLSADQLVDRRRWRDRRLMAFSAYLRRLAQGDAS